MTREKLRHLLLELARGAMTVDEALVALETWPYENLGFARLDHHRILRQGFPEVIFCQGKTVTQVQEIFHRLAAGSGPVLATRATPVIYQAIREICPEARFYEQARCIVYRSPEKPIFTGTVLIISAGTADLPVAEEAAVSAQTMGNPVEQLYDVGVAGLHRLLDNHEYLRRATVIIVVAGMEGALASVVGGLTDRPVIAVPTNIGYGASFGGLAALLTMLNSCASGIGVVNIDNGFGAAALATAINRVAKGELQ